MGGCLCVKHSAAPFSGTAHLIPSLQGDDSHLTDEKTEPQSNGRPGSPSWASQLDLICPTPIFTRCSWDLPGTWGSGHLEVHDWTSVSPSVKWA